MAILKGDQPLLLKLVFAIIAGALLGMYLGSNADLSHAKAVMNVVVSLHHILEQILLFLLPLVILGFITPTFVRFGKNASRMLFTAVGLSYVSSLCASFFALAMGCLAILNLSVSMSVEPLRTLPDIIYKPYIPQLFSVMSALALSLLFGLAIIWTRSEFFSQLLNELEDIVRALINSIFLPLLPFFVGLSFLELAYEGFLSISLPVFVSLVLIVVCCHFIWLAVLYGLAALVSGRNPFQVIRHYLPA